MARSLGLERDSVGNHVKYDAKSGRVTIPVPEGGIREIVNLTAVFDFAKIRTGWIWFRSGVAPSFIEDAALGHKGPKPGDNYKRGFRMNLFSERQLGGVREMMSNSRAQTEAISELFAQYDDAPQSRQGLLPVVRLASVTPVQSQTPQGQAVTNYAPVFVIDGWVDRPAALDAPEAAPAQAQADPASEFGELRVPASRMGSTANVTSLNANGIMPPRGQATAASAPAPVSMESEFGPMMKSAGAA